MSRGIRIAVASGKGGTGKTTFAVSLAAVLAGQGVNVTYVDCDVEEPNGHVFLKPEIDSVTDVEMPVPEIDLEKCTYCGKCSEICEYNAIAVLSDRVMVFPSLCHSCGGCYHICPEKAIREVPRKIGELAVGSGQGVRFYEGRLNVGEAFSPPVTRALKRVVNWSEIALIDAPPGTSCPVVEAVKDADFAVMVTEPTPFGLHDLELAVKMARTLNLPIGVIINRFDIGDDRVEEYCRREKIDVLLRIPFDRGFAEAYSVGNMPLVGDPSYADKLFALHRDIIGRIGNGRAGGS
jgi:MinD superfamily P-loop ATPase